MRRDGVVIIGAGQAGFQAAASLRQSGFQEEVILVGDEPILPYQRPPLSKTYLKGEPRHDPLLLRPDLFYSQNRITMLIGERAVAIDRAGRRVRLASGGALDYGHLVLATGARNRLLPIPGAGLDGVHYLRTVAEADALRAPFRAARSVVVIGAGFIGLEFAAVAAARGAEVHVLEATGRAMGRAIAEPTSAFFAEAHHRMGARLHFHATATRILGEAGRVVGVEQQDGTRIDADLVVIGIGVVPETGLAAESGLPVENGILADEHLLTADPHVSAIGDCAVYPSLHARALARLESVQNAVDHGRTVAARLTGRPAPYTAVPWFWSDQGDLKLQIVGITTGHDGTVLRGAPEESRFSVFCFAGETLLGIESVNRPADHMAGRRLLASGRGLTRAEAADESVDLKALSAVAR